MKALHRALNSNEAITLAGKFLTKAEFCDVNRNF